jgi:F-type H+-transporting ATPase subunit g
MVDASLTAYRAPVTYNLQVTREVLKQVYVAERLQIPHWTTFVSEYNLLWSRARNQAFLRDLVRSGEWMKVGVYVVEGYGIFKARLLVFTIRTGDRADRCLFRRLER